MAEIGDVDAGDSGELEGVGGEVADEEVGLLCLVVGVRDAVDCLGGHADAGHLVVHERQGPSALRQAHRWHYDGAPGNSVGDAGAHEGLELVRAV